MTIEELIAAYRQAASELTAAQAVVLQLEQKKTEAEAELPPARQTVRDAEEAVKDAKRALKQAL